MIKMASDQYYNVASGILIMTAANALSAEDIDLPCDWRTKTMVLIHRIEFTLQNSPVKLEIDGTNWQGASINWASGVGLLDIGSEDCIAHFKEMYTSNLVTAEANVMVTKQGHKSWFFDKPIPVAQSKLYMTGNTTGQTGAQQFGYRIYFTTKNVSDKDWQEVLEARHGYTE